METDVAQSPVVSFRPAKRQKYMRKRPESDDMSHTDTTAGPENPIQEHASDSNDEVAKVTRLQKPRRVRKGGIEFSTSRKQDLEQDSRLESALAENAEADLIRAKFDRFTAHTGQHSPQHSNQLGKGPFRHRRESSSFHPKSRLEHGLPATGVRPVAVIPLE